MKSSALRNVIEVNAPTGTARSPGSTPEPMPDHSALWVVPEDDGRFRRDIEHQLFVKARFHQELLRIIAEIGAQRVLEIGAGSTVDSCFLAAQTTAEFHALDRVKTSAAFARRVGRELRQSVHFHLGDGFHAPFADASFDLVFHQGLLEHFEDPKPLLRENLRLLRPGGILVVDVPQLYSLYTLRKRRRMRRGDWPWGWEREYTAVEMRRLVDGLPMDLVRLSSWGYDFYSSILRHPWRKLMRLNPLRATAPFALLDRLHERTIAPLWEAPWTALEEQFGPHFMMNVTGIYRRRP